MKRVAMLFAGAVAACGVACSFASLDYLQDGPAVDSGSRDVNTTDGDGGAYPTLNAHTTPLATGQTSPNLLAQDSDNLYWVSNMDIMTVAKAGGAARSIGQVSDVLALTTDSDPAGAVYVVTGTKVVTLQKQSGVQATVFSAEAGAPVPDTILVDDTSLFVLQIDGTDSTSSMVQLPKTGGTATDIAFDPDLPPQTMTLTASDLLWGSNTMGDSDAFFELPKGSTGAFTILTVDNSNFPTASHSRQLAANDNTIFWTDGAYLYARDRQPSSVPTDLYDSPDNDVFPAIAVDSTNLYTLNLFDHSVMRVSLDGQQNVRLVNNLTQPTSLVVDDTSVYVSVGPAAAGQILKIDK